LAISLVPYVAVPNVAKMIKMLIIDVAKSTFPMFSAPSTLEIYGAIIIG